MVSPANVVKNEVPPYLVSSTQMDAAPAEGFFKESLFKKKFHTILVIFRIKLKQSSVVMSAYKLLKHLTKHLVVSRDGYVRYSYRNIMACRFDLTRYRSIEHLMINEIEINKNCDLNCVMCNTQLSTRKQQNMSPELFENILRLLKRTRHSMPIPLHTIGEPLLNPLLEEYFKLARKHKIKLFLSTNGRTLDKKLDLIFRSADVIDILRFSVDGASRGTYEKIRYPGKFDRLIDNLALFTRENKRGKYIKEVAMSSIVSRDVQHELAYHLHFYSQYVPMENISLGLVNGLSPDNTYFFENSILKNHIKPNRPCRQLNGAMQILADGRVSACCRDYNADLIYGNINDSTPEQLINSSRALELRDYHINNQVPENILCASCYMIDPKVTRLFELFVKVLILRYHKSWNIDAIQQRFDRFFNLFKNGIPSPVEYLSLMR